MALQLSLSPEASGIGLEVPAAYVRIVAFTCGTSNQVQVACDFYATEEARQTGLNPIKGQTFAVDGFDFAAQVGIKTALYQAIKAQPGFETALDV